MIYTYCKKTSRYRAFGIKAYLKSLIVFGAMFGVASYYMYNSGIKNTIKSMTIEERIMLINDSDPFTENKMAEMMKELNVKFAWIPMAQSMIETGHFHSDIFIENNNLFGMKEAKSRITTAIGTNKNHAEYNTWRESIYDYAFYQSRYLGKIRSESEYYQYLSASYAEDPTYVAKIKQMVERHKLKQLFN
jgi:hypothetical protein